jgi:hypothetical protein
MNISQTQVDPRVISHAISLLTDSFSNFIHNFEKETMDFAGFLYSSPVAVGFIVPDTTRVKLEFLLKHCSKDRIVNFVYQFDEALKYENYRKFLKLFSPIFDGKPTIKLRYKGNMRDFTPIDLYFQEVHFGIISDPSRTTSFELLGDFDKKHYSVLFTWKKENWVVSKIEEDEDRIFWLDEFLKGMEKEEDDL